MKAHHLKNVDVELIASIAAGLKGEYQAGDIAWKNSPFEWIKKRPSRQVGKIGEQLVAGWCAAKGLNVTRSKNSDADRVIEGLRVEIKFSTLWAGGSYKFQQIRDQEYDVLLCIGVSPFDAHVWIMNKSDIPFDRLVHQHGGGRGRDTWWISVDPENPPAWLAKKRGGFGEMERFFKAHGKGA